MAFDKVVDSSVLDAGLKQIADAIREKGGTSDNLAFPTAMAEAIAAIESGNGKLITGTITFDSQTDAITLQDAFPPQTQAPVLYFVAETGVPASNESHTKSRLLSMFNIRGDGGIISDTKGSYIGGALYSTAGNYSADVKKINVGTRFNQSSAPTGTYDYDCMTGNISNGLLYFNPNTSPGFIAGRTYLWGVWLYD